MCVCIITYTYVIYTYPWAVYFLEKFAKIRHNQCGEELFSFLFLLFFYITNPYLSVFQYNDSTLHPYHGTELRFYVHILFFLRYILHSGKFYEVKALVAIVVYFIVFLRQTIDNFDVSFLKEKGREKGHFLLKLGCNTASTFVPFSSDNHCTLVPF
ncbi:conserved Plasmodium membrane protein, unknown function [Plasmodium ovale wallikeri]|uniref:Uncharacterized protein n=1 Tax=Plasmodium ovale wallikeri TaxID=864142 RepID=A0A1A8ZPM4_PLAOA|nr:conserved Plasmodium membrane protein, unknown function [Plasmodium ovale wallikeri]SBT45830.1 conserved Plasmodium membrane protein, unknown function [Plasmodium ovale wallikeri]